MSTSKTPTAEAVAKCGGDVLTAIRQMEHEEVMSLSDFQMVIYYEAREAGADHADAYDAAEDAPFKEVAE